MRVPPAVYSHFERTSVSRSRASPRSGRRSSWVSPLPGVPLGPVLQERFPNAFAVNASTSGVSAGPSPLSTGTQPGPSSPSRPPNPPNALESNTLKIEEVKPPATGTRKAKVLYDYDAADTSELSLLADELITVYTVPGMDPDWLIGERGNQKGKVPVTYLELLS